MSDRKSYLQYNTIKTLASRTLH